MLRACESIGQPTWGQAANTYSQHNFPSGQAIEATIMHKEREKKPQHHKTNGVIKLRVLFNACWEGAKWTTTRLVLLSIRCCYPLWKYKGYMLPQLKRLRPTACSLQPVCRWSVVKMRLYLVLELKRRCIWHFESVRVKHSWSVTSQLLTSNPIMCAGVRWRRQLWYNYAVTIAGGGRGFTGEE